MWPQAGPCLLWRFFFGDIQFVSNHGLASVIFLRLGGTQGGHGRQLALLERCGSGRGPWPGGEWLVGVVVLQEEGRVWAKTAKLENVG